MFGKLWCEEGLYKLMQGVINSGKDNNVQVILKIFGVCFDMICQEIIWKLSTP